MTAPSFADYVNTGRSIALTERPELLLYVGHSSLMFIEGAAAMADRLTGYAAEGIKGTFLDGAEGDLLTDRADDWWGIQRRDAVQAIGTVRFTRATAAAGAGTLAAGTVVATVRDANGKETQFTTDGPLSFSAAELGPKSVGVKAVTAGAAGNVAAGSVSRVISVLWDTTFTVTNLAGTVGGAEAESDPDLRERVRQFPATIRRGTREAIEYGALQVPQVVKSTAIEDETGLITVYVTDGAGNSTGGNVTVAPGLVADGTMTKAVAIELLKWYAMGALVTVVGGSLLSQDITVSLLVRDGFDVSSKVAQIQAAITAGRAKLRIGDALYRETIQADVKGVAPSAILKVNVLLPLADIQPDPNEIIRAGTVLVE